MKKRILGVILALTIIIGMTGCGYSENEAYNPDPSWEQNNNDNSDSDTEDIDDNDDTDDNSGDTEVIDDGEGEPEFDGWGFPNSDLDTSAGVHGYYISGKDYDRLISNLSDTEKQNLINSYDDYKNNYNKDDKYDSYEPWSGSCYGMSMTSILKARGLITTEELHGSDSLEDSPLTKQDLSAINYFFWQQNLAPCQTAMQEFESRTSIEQVSSLVNAASSNTPFQIAFFWQNDLSDNADVYGHSVVGYGLERGSYTWTKGEYSHTFNVKILTYDCSYPDDDNNMAAFYLDTTNGSWVYPQDSAWSTSNGITDVISDNGQLGCILTNSEYLEPVDYQNGYISELEYNLSEHQPDATISMESDQNYSIKSTSGSANVRGLVVSNSTYGKKIKTSATVCGKSGTVHVYIPQGEKSYTVSSDEPLYFSLNVGNMLISVDSDKAGKVEFKNDGSLKVTSDIKPEDCNITVTSDEDNTFGIEDCHTVDINDATSKNLTVEPGGTGVEIKGDDLSRMSVTGDVTGQKIDINTATEGDAVEITKDTTGDNIIAKADTTGDGKYDKTISKIKVPKKSNQKITLKQKTLKIKRGKTTKLKAKAKTQLIYKKTSGNKNITLNSSGKVKVNKKLKKGTYKIKVNVTAKASKKYKKASKKFTIKIIVK